MYLTIGGDEYVTSFNGKVGLFGIFVGPEAYHQSLDFNYRFSYGEGAE